jgi:alpha,alpha-trehalase
MVLKRMAFFIYRSYCFSFLFILFFLPNIGFAESASLTCPSDVVNDPAVLNYIYRSWDVLTRTNKTLVQTAMDPKFKQNFPYIVYISADESLAAVSNHLKNLLPAAEFQKIKLEILPNDLNNIPPGLLYLPYPYVVPGGMFNEMYGWDSYFIILGLIKSNKLQLAKDMVDNFLYEIKYYGKILNSNRSFHLQRSQPPLLTEMILAVYDKTHDKTWLKSTLPYIDKFYAFWTSPPHLIPQVGLSRYFAQGQGPAPEVEADKQQNYYQKVKSYYHQHFSSDYVISNYYLKKTNQLTDLFYENDRSDRESGFDLTGQYGAFSAMIIDFAPVTLNTFLFVMEKNTAQIENILGDEAKATIWQQRAKRRADLINRYLWDDNAGYYFDYNFITQTTRPYIDATTFLPLWAGIASPYQASRIVENLPSLETNCGIVTSAYVTHMQWDAPYGWAPLQLFTIIGLNRYGYQQDASRLACKFMNLINQDFRRTQTIVEKYDMRRCSSTITQIHYGYSSNEIGFGWTNGVYLFLRDFLIRRQND